MDELFSCRNCIHDCGQSLLIGRGNGFCLLHDSVLTMPSRSTCKYLHRKDLPHFVVDEGIREHASEFVGFSAIADLYEHKPVERVAYSEKYSWMKRQFDSVNHALAQYCKTADHWVFIQGMSSGIDGRRSLAHASLVRRYMNKCDTWRSSYRLVLSLVQELPDTPCFQDKDLNTNGSEPDDDFRQDAVWDVFFDRLSGIQEYGFHSGLEDLMWATDSLNGWMVSLNWRELGKELKPKSEEWMDQIIKQATDEGAFFPAPPPNGEQREML